MAQEEEIAATRAIVLDANILLRGVLGSRVRGLIEQYSERIIFLTPRSCVDDVHEYLPILCAQRKWEPTSALQVLDALLTTVQVVEIGSLADVEHEARHRIELRDPDDWPVVALAMATSAPIWTEDTDFFGTGVATWTTQTVEIYLAGNT